MLGHRSMEVDLVRLQKSEAIQLIKTTLMGWENPQGDEHFKKQRKQADSGKSAALFYRMMKEIGVELHLKTNALTLTNVSPSEVKILTEASGITLSPDQGGHKVFLNSPLSTVLYCDITMFATEFGAEYVPVTHPEHATFSTERPFLSQTFNLIFCHGQVLRTHPRMEYREAYEATRLTFPQLTLAMQCISEGGTFIMLLHKVEAWDTMDLLYRFLQFSDIELFKPIKKHAIRSTFYLVAKQVRPSSEAARLAVQHWKEGWWQATFVRSKLAGLGRKVLTIQADALKKADFVR
ncbi:uncharacterized protein LY89DRAFT_701089 [Mollisia scopiformis]|uniref:Ribosomal RNA methyltransferase FtsJ domain-containing protein n=1 Tax=Mollisia scopiformis TaxID=149040 RepID=A0A132BD24_MOLSC|nr:uncharacterized protein LY89DRAFT_701089 [Mollisia scopiformis]KUJ10153.1 hypothetical protein LY89DRAFT_701089 [Mollisia scopiformis]